MEIGGHLEFVLFQVFNLKWVSQQTGKFQTRIVTRYKHLQIYNRSNCESQNQIGIVLYKENRCS